MSHPNISRNTETGALLGAVATRSNPRRINCRVILNLKVLIGLYNCTPNVLETGTFSAVLIQYQTKPTKVYKSFLEILSNLTGWRILMNNFQPFPWKTCQQRISFKFVIYSLIENPSSPPLLPPLGSGYYYSFSYGYPLICGRHYPHL